ncbi:hypothetical protein PFISCL1PPCAC_957, partial [Pristionchus fissidentatus]
SMVESLISVNVDAGTIKSASKKFRLSITAISMFTKIVNVFIDFKSSPCSSSFIHSTALSLVSGECLVKEEFDSIDKVEFKFGETDDEKIESKPEEGVGKHVIKEEPIDYME